MAHRKSIQNVALHVSPSFTSRPHTPLSSRTHSPFQFQNPFRTHSPLPILEPFQNPPTPSKFRTLAEPTHLPSRAHTPFSLPEPTPTSRPHTHPIHPTHVFESVFLPQQWSRCFLEQRVKRMLGAAGGRCGSCISIRNSLDLNLNLNLILNRNRSLNRHLNLNLNLNLNLSSYE